MPNEFESPEGDFAPFAHVCTAASFGKLRGAGSRTPWPLAIEYQVPEIIIDIPDITIRAPIMSKSCREKASSPLRMIPTRKMSSSFTNAIVTPLDVLAATYTLHQV
jgi:hypothetical protein